MKSTRQTPLVVVSYNVHRCLGSDRRCRPDRVADVLATLTADLIGLQEVRSEETGPHEDDQAQILATRLGMQLVRGPTMLHQEATYGNALLTSLPILAVDRYRLEVQGREPRGALAVQVLGRGGLPLRVVVTHLGLRSKERRLQATMLGRMLRREHGPLVVLGDLNEWHCRASRALVERIDPRLGPTGRRTPRTFPAPCPLWRLDQIVVRPPHALGQLQAVRTAAARLASDHLPLRAVLHVS